MRLSLRSSEMAADAMFEGGASLVEGGGEGHGDDARSEGSVEVELLHGDGEHVTQLAGLREELGKYGDQDGVGGANAERDSEVGDGRGECEQEKMFGARGLERLEQFGGTRRQAGEAGAGVHKAGEEGHDGDGDEF